MERGGDGGRKKGKWRGREERREEEGERKVRGRGREAEERGGRIVLGATSKHSGYLLSLVPHTTAGDEVSTCS